MIQLFLVTLYWLGNFILKIRSDAQAKQSSTTATKEYRRIQTTILLSSSYFDVSILVVLLVGSLVLHREARHS